MIAKSRRLIVVVLMIAGFALIIYSSLSLQAESCEVCVTYNGRTDCRKARGNTREEAVRTASDNACALLASGMTAGIACSNTPPTSVECEE